MSRITILPQNETLELKALDTQQIDGFLALVREAKIFWILKIKIKFITMNKKNQKNLFYPSQFQTLQSWTTASNRVHELINVNIDPQSFGCAHNHNFRICQNR